MNLSNKKIAIVCDWLTDWGGAELVLEHMLEVFPHADIFTSVCFAHHPVLEWKKITTSFLQKVPFFNKRHKLSLMLRPYAFESLDISEYDIVISSSSAESKGIITKPETLHICYCHTPTRYFWSHYHEYLNMLEFGWLNFFAKWFAPKVIYKLRQWDYVAAQRPDVFIANSKNTRNRILKYYSRDAEVVCPGVDTDSFYIQDKEDYYLAVGRAIPYKKFDLLVDTFNENGKKLIIVTNTDNKLYRELQEKSEENIEWIFAPNRNELRGIFAKAKAFLFPQEEDFGLTPIEAIASGIPVIAYAKGGALETVIDGVTGVFFKEQTVESLGHAISQFETLRFDAHVLQKHAKVFDKKEFQRSLQEVIKKHL